VQWYKLIENLKNRGYAFDLRFSAEVEEFMKLILFTFSLDTLIQYNVLSLDNPVVRGALRDKDMFESLFYEILVAANYTLNGFKARMPDLFNEGRIDIYAEKGLLKFTVSVRNLDVKSFMIM